MLKVRTKFQKGINLGGWLSQCDHTKKRYDTFIVEEDFKRIREWGFDHVRIPVDYNLVEDKNGHYIERGFLYIENAINWCRKYKLMMILDLHKTCGFSFDSGENENGFFENNARGGALRERFLKLWEEFARRFSGDYEMLSFGLLNEITNKEYMPVWAELINECVARIRRYSKDIDIIYGGYYNNGLEAIPDLPLPADKHIIYEFHCYAPMEFTHQNAPWCPWIPQGVERSFESVHYTAKDFLDSFTEAVRVANERGVGLYCGEYGVIDIATPEDTLSWFREINEAFEEIGVARALWCYRSMNFALENPKLDPVRDEILKII